MSFSTIEHVYRYLNEVPKFQELGKKAANFDLEHVVKFCTSIGNPHKNLHAVHVAGTNGKGSTCQIIASIYQEAGYEVGLYTSPHLMDVRERFRINAQMIPEGDLLDFFQRFESLIKSFPLTYFELCTVIAFWWFSEKKTDIAVIEVGLGGRLDATNIIRPIVSVITNISLDHTDLLGNDTVSIAREKAGIIKEGIPVVLGEIEGEARNEIIRVAKEMSSPYIEASDLNPRWDGGRCILEVNSSQLVLETDLHMPVQAKNIAAAWKVVHVLNRSHPVPRQAIERGVNTVNHKFGGHGRFERLVPGREWYYDGAHNLEAVKALKQAISIVRPINDCILVLSMMRDKISTSVMMEFSEFKKIFYHTIKSERAATCEDVREWLPEAVPIPKGTKERKNFFKEIASELVIFTGSFYFYPVVRGWLSNEANIP